MYAGSVIRQIILNQARTPTERFEALCNLLDAARAMAPLDPAACERRRRVMATRKRDREKLRALFRKLSAGGRQDAS